MEEQHSTSSARSSLVDSSFTTTELIDKIKETLNLAREISQHPNAVDNDKIQELLKIQCCNALKLLTKLNQGGVSVNNRDCDFMRPQFDDEQKTAMLVEINDALIDKTIHYMDLVKNPNSCQTLKPDLIQVQIETDYKKNKSKIFINDYKTQPNKPKNLLNSGQKRKSDGMPSTSSPRDSRITFMAAANVKRPQIAYKINVDNNYSTPFIPKLSAKPNAKISLEESIRPIAYDPSQLGTTSHGINCPSHHYPHPYQHELETFEVSNDFLNEKINLEIKVPSIEEKKLVTINQREHLKNMVDILKKNYKEISVDVEHHSFRSYQGLTCLLQISTDDTDYVIDVFPLWSEMQMLNEVFTSPKILKVFHSSTFDIIWLQRDLGIYVVNMFDTWVAATTLGYERCSLSSLVSKLCDFDLDKRFQLADWRIRPLLPEMLQYARLDTHFLLYIYRQLKNELLAKSDSSANLLRSVMERSRQMCLNRYEKKLLENQDHLHLVWKDNLRFNSKQLAALKSLFVWRDIVARNEDESTGYVLPNNLLLKICEILPREQQGVLACCNPIPPLVRQYINEIHKIILQARSKAVEDDVDLKSHPLKAQKSEQTIMIDLTDDPLTDHQENVKNHDQHLGGEHHQEERNEGKVIPILMWSRDTGLFELNNEIRKEDSQKATTTTIEDVKMIDQDDLDNRSTNSSCNSSNMISMFVSNLGRHIESDIRQRQAKNNVDKLFDGYITFYQRYLIKKQSKQPISKLRSGS